MFKIKLFIFIFILNFLSIFSQEENINNFKYIIVPEQFEFQKSEDSFQINSLTKFLFNKYGFNVLLSSEKYPEDLSKNKCLALTTRMNDNSGFFGKKINFDLVDCSNIIIYSSKNGMSKEKEYKKGFQQAIRNSFESLKEINYKYEPSEVVIHSTIDPIIVEDIKDKREIIKTEIVSQLPSDDKIVKTPKEIDKKVEMESDIENSSVFVPNNEENFLSADKTFMGYTLVDSSNILQYELQKTSVENVYIVKGIDGILFKSKNKWILEYYNNNQLFKQELNIKF